jgi:hypothetical protein
MCNLCSITINQAAFARSIGHLKIGAHRGALIAITLNERLDYFGQTVISQRGCKTLPTATEFALPKKFTARRLWRKLLRHTHGTGQQNTPSGRSCSLAAPT